MDKLKPICTEDLSIFSSDNREEFRQRFVEASVDEQINILRIKSIEESVEILSELSINYVQNLIQKVEKKGLDTLLVTFRTNWALFTLRQSRVRIISLPQC